MLSPETLRSTPPLARRLSRHDSVALGALHRRAPLGGPDEVTFERDAGFFAWADAVFPDYAYEGAFASSSLVASLAVGAITVSFGGAWRRAAYFCEARTDMAYRRRGLLELLGTRLASRYAKTCDVGLIVRRTSNSAAERCMTMQAPVPGLVSVTHPLVVLTLPPQRGAEAMPSDHPMQAEHTLARPHHELTGLPGFGYTARGREACVLLADTSTVKRRVDCQVAPLDVRALTAPDAGTADTLLCDATATLQRPVRIALAAAHPLVTRLRARGATEIAGEVRILARAEHADAVLAPAGDLLLDGSLL
jgi:hypothetical protein